LGVGFASGVLAAATAATPAHAVTIRVSQESAAGLGDFDSNVLGFLTPYSTTDTASDFYAYNTTFPASYGNTTPGLTAALSQLFMVQASDGLSLFIVHDAPQTPPGGTASTAFTLTGDTASILVEDDGDAAYTDTGTSFSANHSWARCCTDGYVIGSLDGDWTMIGGFVETAPTGLDGWSALSADGSTLDLALELGRRVRLDVPSETVVPEPAAALGLLAVAGLALARRRA
jgi:hypothetical protein